jgi:hypothetical protein
MVDKKILEYVKATMEKGYPIHMIRKALEGTGWPKPEIDHALAVVQGKKPPAQPKPLPPKPIIPEHKLTPINPATEFGLPRSGLMGQSKKEIIKLLVHGPHPKHPLGHPKTKKARIGFVASLIAGILMLIASIADLMVGFIGYPYTDLEFIYTLGLGNIIPQDPSFIINSVLTPFGQVLTIIGFILSIFVIIGSLLMRKYDRVDSGGKIVLVCSILNLMALRGLGLMGIVAAVIGMIGGVLGIKRK